MGCKAEIRCISRWSVTHINELLLLLLCHISQAVVFPSQVSLQAGQGVNNHPLHLTTLSPRTGRGEAQPADTASGPDAGRQNVFVIKHSVGYLETEEGEIVLHMQQYR